MTRDLGIALVWNDFYLAWVAFLSSVDSGNLTKRNDYK